MHRGRSLGMHGLGLPAVLSLAPGGRQVDTVNTQNMLKHGENYKNRPKKQKIQGAKYKKFKMSKMPEIDGKTGKKLFFPQNVKIPEIRKFENLKSEKLTPTMSNKHLVDFSQIYCGLCVVAIQIRCCSVQNHYSVYSAPVVVAVVVAAAAAAAAFPFFPDFLVSTFAAASRSASASADLVVRV